MLKEEGRRIRHFFKQEKKYNRQKHVFTQEIITTWVNIQDFSCDLHLLKI